MKHIKLNLKTGEIEIAEVPIPSVKDKEVLVDNEYSVISIGTEPDKLDNFTINLLFEDSSISTIIYTNIGDNTYSKEMCEFFADRSVTSLIDFQKLEFISNGKRKQFKKRFSLDKGRYRELKKFAEMITTGNINNENFESYILSSVATLNARKK